MGPVLKVKNLKKTTSPESNAVAKSKIKWEKPKNLISAQAGVTKIKNVKKRSFDPIKANRGVVLLQNIPHGFYEDQMREYFSQFGLVTRVRLARSERSGRSKGFAYIEFKVPEVAQIAADTMNNYIMFKHVLKTAYIPPEKQTYNFFRKDVTFTTDTDGRTSFSSDKIKSIEKEIQNINRVPTDEEHAKRLKRTQKTLQKQQKKYGVDLSNILVSGTSTTTDVEPKVVKKKEKATKKVAEKKTEPKREVKPVAVKKDKKKAAEADSKKPNCKSLLKGLMNRTYETDTSDDDFKIDHSFSGSSDESDGSSAEDEEILVDYLSQKLKAAFKKAEHKAMETSESEDDEDSEVDEDSEIDGDSEDDANSEDYAESEDVEESDDDAESDDDEPEIVPQTLKTSKKAVKGVTSNGTVDSKTKAGLKRKHKDIPELVSAISQTELNIVAKKKKLSQNKKKEVVPEPEAPKVPVKKPKQKQIRTPTTSSESESLKLQQKQKKAKLALDVATTSAVDNSSKPASVSKKMKKKQAKQILNTSNSSLPETTSSEPDIPKQNVKKSKLKSKADSVAKPQGKVETNAKKITANTANISSPENKKQNKKNKPAKGGVEAKLNSSSTSSEPEFQIQNQKTKKKQKTNGAVKAVVSLESVMKPKKVKPVTSSLINDKKSAKLKVKPNIARQMNAWSTVSETDGGDEPKKGNATLKTIVRKKVQKKKSDTANLLEAKKVKQTPADLLNVVSSKVLKQNNQLKLKKKSK